MKEGYDQFLALCKRYVLLDVLVAALEHDKLVIPKLPLKMKGILPVFFQEVIDMAKEDRRKMKDKMKELGGKIIKIEQTREVREVHVVFNGYESRYGYLNEMIRSECETLFQEYLKKNV